MKKIALLGLLMLSSILVSQVSYANIITNGSFETGLDSWIATPFSGGEIVVSGTEGATDGIQAVVFNGGNLLGGTLSQSFVTTPGAEYQLTFDYGVHGVNAQSIQVEVLGSGSLLNETVADSASFPTSFNSLSFNFIADSSLTTLKFSNFSILNESVSTDSVLDNISVTISTIFTTGSATFDPSTYIIHIPCVAVDANHYWVDLQIATIEPLTIKIINVGQTPGNTNCSTLDLNTLTLNVPRLFINGGSYKLSLQWDLAGFFKLTGIEDTGSSYGDEGKCFVACQYGDPLHCAVSCDSLFGGVYALSVGDYFDVRLGPTSWNACANRMRDLGQPGW